MKLFWLEIYKTFSRWRTYIGFGFIALIVLLTEVVMKLSAVEIVNRMMRFAQKDFLIFGNVLNGWFVTSFIMNSLHFHIPFLIALVAGDIVSGEATSGTVRFLLIRPPSRYKIIAAKYVTTLFYTTGLVIFLGLMCVLPGLALFGSGDLIIHHYGKFGIVFIPEVEIPASNVLRLHGCHLVHDGGGLDCISSLDPCRKFHRPDRRHDGRGHRLSGDRKFPV